MSEDKRLDEIIRVRRCPNNFVTMDKTFLEDTRLSFKAKGILAYLLSKPDNWKVIVGNLVNYAADGKASVYAGLKELKECGYYQKVPVRDEKGRRILRWESTIYEIPELPEMLKTEENSGVSLLTDFQEIENQDLENLYIENRERNNNYINNNNYTKNNNQSSPVSQDKEEGSINPTRQTRQTDGQAHLEAVFSVIRENIDYENLKLSHPDEMDLVDNFVSVMLDTLLSKSKTVHINGQEKPRELVKSNLMKLNYADMEYALMRFQEQGQRIKKKRTYILAILYNASMERAAHYTNCVQADWKENALASIATTDKGNYPLI